MRDLRQFQCELRAILDQGDVNAAAEYFRSAEGESLTPKLLVEKSRVIQASDGFSGYCLDDAERLLRDAISIDENCLDAYLELAHYYFSVKGDSETAMTYFSELARRAENYLAAALHGKEMVLSDFDNHADEQPK